MEEGPAASQDAGGSRALRRADAQEPPEGGRRGTQRNTTSSSSVDCTATSGRRQRIDSLIPARVVSGPVGFLRPAHSQRRSNRARASPRGSLQASGRQARAAHAARETPLPLPCSHLSNFFLFLPYDCGVRKKSVSNWFYDTSTGAATGAVHCDSFVGGARIAQGVGYQGIRWTRGFTWFGPPERNTLRPRVNEVVLLCLSARLRSSFIRVCVCPDLL
jgi:hypothetical protein